MGSYAGSDEDEFFAELTMWYFGTHGNMGMRGPKPANGPEGLKQYDPEAFALWDEFYSGRMKIALMEPGWAGETRRAHTTFGALPFKLQEVKLLDSPFKHARDEDAAYLSRSSRTGCSRVSANTPGSNPRRRFTRAGRRNRFPVIRSAII